MKRKLSAEEIQRRQRTCSGFLTEHQVGRIKWSLESGESPRILAEIYGVSLWTIRAIGRGDTWAWVQVLPPDEVLGNLPPTLEMLESKKRMLEAIPIEGGEKILEQLVKDIAEIKARELSITTALDELKGDSHED